MDVQAMIVLALVGAAALYLANKAWTAARKSRHAADGCGGACGCGEDPAGR